jgi:anti-sigma B factor antagonist
VDISGRVCIDGSYLLVLSGELDTAAADAVQRAGMSLITPNGCDRLMIDMRDVSFIDCSGIGALVSFRNEAMDLSVRLTILDPSYPVFRLLQLARLDQLFEIEFDRVPQPARWRP